MKINRIASIKGGTDNIANAIAEQARSKAEPGRIAQRIASGTPMRMPPISAIIISSSETGSRPEMACSTVSPVRCEVAEIAS